MDSKQILEEIAAHRDEIRTRFDVERLLVFGSVARGEASDESDVDLLVEFRGLATFRGYMGLLFYLEDMLDRKVDLATPRSLRSFMRPAVERDSVRVA